MAEFRHSWRFELSADAEIWLMTRRPERADQVRKAFAGRKSGNIVDFSSVDAIFDALQKHAPTILVIDAEDTADEGVELLKDLRSNPRLPNIPVLPILTQIAWDKYGPALYNYNVTQALIPPFHGEDIALTITAQFLAFQKNGLEKLVHDARTQFQAENFESAGKLFSQARDMRKTMSTEVGLASSLAGAGKFAAAQKIVNDAKSLDVDSFDLQLLGLTALVNLRIESERSLALVRQTVNRLLPLCLYEDRALRMFQKLVPKPELATMVYETFAAPLDGFPQVIFEAAKCYFTLARHDDSLRVGKHAYEKGLRKTELLNLLGVLYKRRLEPAYSLLFYTEALRNSPEDHRLHFNKGLCLEEMHKVPEAMAAYSDCLVHKPDFLKARERLDALSRHARKGTP